MATLSLEFFRSASATGSRPLPTLPKMTLKTKTSTLVDELGSGIDIALFIYDRPKQILGLGKVLGRSKESPSIV